METKIKPIPCVLTENELKQLNKLMEKEKPAMVLHLERLPKRFSKGRIQVRWTGKLIK